MKSTWVFICCWIHQKKYFSISNPKGGCKIIGMEGKADFSCGNDDSDKINLSIYFGVPRDHKHYFGRYLQENQFVSKEFLVGL